MMVPSVSWLCLLLLAAPALASASYDASKIQDGNAISQSMSAVEESAGSVLEFGLPEETQGRSLLVRKALKRKFKRRFTRKFKRSTKKIRKNVKVTKRVSVSKGRKKVSVKKSISIKKSKGKKRVRVVKKVSVVKVGKKKGVNVGKEISVKKSYSHDFKILKPRRKWDVCIRGRKQAFGKVSGWQPSGIIVWLDGDGIGRCKVMEYAGGFDGFFSINAGDGHEDGFAEAVKLLLQDDKAKIGYGFEKYAGNRNVNAFLTELLRISRPIDMDFPQDEARANNGERKRNIEKVSAGCEAMINVWQC